MIPRLSLAVCRLSSSPDCVLSVAKVAASPPSKSSRCSTSVVPSTSASTGEQFSVFSCISGEFLSCITTLNASWGFSRITETRYSFLICASCCICLLFSSFLFSLNLLTACWKLSLSCLSCATSFCFFS